MRGRDRRFQRTGIKSAFRMSLLSNPLLLSGVVPAQLLCIGMLYLPLGQTLLHTEPVTPQMWVILFLLSLTLLVAMGLHKLSWSWRRRRRA
ncbi:MAG: hypothetical protein GX616_18800 [Planctomycetes bacterium]|nr:hypothetical protein [Planctomycetota bacterium]